MRSRCLHVFPALILLYSHAAVSERGPGWDYGAEVVYQDAADVEFDGGSFASLDDDLGLALSFGYRFNDRLELTFGLDWNSVDYDFTVASGTIGIGGFSGRGDLESFTPNVGVNFNFIEGDVTPWIDIGQAKSTPDFDQLKLGIAARY